MIKLNGFFESMRQKRAIVRQKIFYRLGALIAFTTSLCCFSSRANADLFGAKFCSEKAVVLPMQVLFVFGNLLSTAKTWFDYPLRQIFKVAKNMGEISYTALVDSHLLTIIIGFGFALWLAFQIWEYVSRFYEQDEGDFFTALGVGTFRVLVVVCLLQWGVLNLFDHFIGVFVTTAGNVATKMVYGSLGDVICGSALDAANRAGKEVSCTFEEPLGEDSGPMAIYHSVSKLLTAISFKFKMAAATGQGVTMAGWVAPAIGGISLTPGFCWPNLGVMASGAIIFLFALYFMFSIPLKMVDIAMRIAMIYALLPLFVAAWAFPLTRRYTKIGWGMVMYVVVYLLMFGVLACVAASLITAGLSNDNVVQALEGNAEGFLSNIIGGADNGGEEAEGVGFFMIFMASFIAVKAFGSLGALAGHISDNNDMGMADSIGKALAGSLIKAGMAGSALINRGVDRAVDRAAESHGVRSAARRQAMAGSHKPNNALAGASSGEQAQTGANADAAGTQRPQGGAGGGQGGGSQGASTTGGDMPNNATAMGVAPKKGDGTQSVSSTKNSDSFAKDAERQRNENVDAAAKTGADEATKKAVDGAERQGEQAVDATRKRNVESIDGLVKQQQDAEDMFREKFDSPNRKQINKIAEMAQAEKTIREIRNGNERMDRKKELDASYERLAFTGSRGKTIRNMSDAELDQVIAAAKTINANEGWNARLRGTGSVVGNAPPTSLDAKGYFLDENGKIYCKDDETRKAFTEKAERSEAMRKQIGEILGKDDLSGQETAAILETMADLYNKNGGDMGKIAEDIGKLSGDPNVSKALAQMAGSEEGRANIANLVSMMGSEEGIAMAMDFADGLEERNLLYGDNEKAGLDAAVNDLVQEDYYKEKDLAVNDLKGQEKHSSEDLLLVSERAKRLYLRLEKLRAEYEEIKSRADDKESGD